MLGTRLSRLRPERNDTARENLWETPFEQGFYVGRKDVLAVEHDHIAEASANIQFAPAQQAEIAGAQIHSPA